MITTTLTRLSGKYYALLRNLWMRYFWTLPDNLWALKVTLCIAIMLIPFSLVGHPFVGCTLALGSVGASLAETDDHPKGRLRSISFTVLSFALMSLGVEVLTPHPLLFAIGIATGTFALALAGGMGPRYNGVTFGALLVAIYAMLGTGFAPWYYQPVLLPLGALLYGILSWWLLHMRPYRLLKEQLAGAYKHLADYLELKATLFPCPAGAQKSIRTRLAEKNITVAQGIEGAKNVLYACLEAMQNKSLEPLNPHYRQWILLQQLHERAASSHQNYEVLTRRCQNKLLLEGFGRLLNELAKAMRTYADTIFTGNAFVVPGSLKWTVEVVEKQLAQSTNDPEYTALELLFNNVSRMVVRLEQAAHNTVGTNIPIQEIPFQSPPAMLRLKNLLHFNHPRCRHALRLSLSLTLAYVLVQLFNIPKGAWMLLTVLFVCQQGYVATRQRFVQRIMGTVAGVVLGTALTYLVPTTQGQMALLLVSVFTFFYWVRKRYSIAVAFVTIFVIAVFNLQTGTGVAVMEYRMLCTWLGAVMAFMAVRFVLPDWQYRHLPQLVAMATRKTNRYLRTIIDTDVRGQVYYHNRRAAHKADSELTHAWKCMLMEPHTTRFMLRKAYALTYLHHTLISYISALGVHGYNKPLTPHEQALCHEVSRIIEAVHNQCVAGTPEQGRKLSYADAKQWLQRTMSASITSKNQHAVIIFNIAQTAVELLRETENNFVASPATRPQHKA